MDLTLTILEKLIAAKPNAAFVLSLHQQYCNRGGLSKKQLEGLYAIAQKSEIISAPHLATLEAIIKKKPTRYRSEKIERAPVYEKENMALPFVQAILEKRPQHKMALFLQAKILAGQAITPGELTELKRLHKHLTTSL
jgi:hypothetical protein